MKRVVTAEEMRAFEQSFFESGRGESLSWMERAASGAADVIERDYAGKRILIVCGGGNNGGDGLALLRILKLRGFLANGVLLSSADRLSPDAKTNFLRAQECSCLIEPALSNEALFSAELLVDAIFGTGLSRAVMGAYANVVERMNASGKPIFALDMPSGVDAGTGELLGAAIRANACVTFQYYKRGQLLFPGKANCGAVTIVPLTDEDDPSEGTTFHFGADDASRLLPQRRANAHKGDSGRTLLCVGSERYVGAALMSAAACLRGGCGVLTVCVPQGIKYAFTALPEACVTGVGTSGEWDEAAAASAIGLLFRQTALAMGCGMGAGAIFPLIEAALTSRLPLVLDADALNVLARERRLFSLLHAGVVLTPHPGEMARLTNLPIDEILQHPIEIARGFSARWGCTVLLKGATSCIADGESVRLNTTGNAGLAKGGSGDVLTGLIASMLSQGLCALDAASVGAYLLGASVDEAVRLLNNRMLLARDVLDVVAQTIERAPFADE